MIIFRCYSWVWPKVLAGIWWANCAGIALWFAAVRKNAPEAEENFEPENNSPRTVREARNRYNSKYAANATALLQ